ncbi:hypothetical protein BT67DRAFT_290284 [Trichocladium antarcticum]|uniref:Uncharacterized protein n=1 Tax=Trichocladium antarcticum TaxID=1450529 RepID=A0AAN6ZEM0_9PEZI|nr:hypothetical protein BT67DRAFT_290284 [Trichocladium antarcticum]
MSLAGVSSPRSRDLTAGKPHRDGKMKHPHRWHASSCSSSGQQALEYRSVGTGRNTRRGGLPGRLGQTTVQRQARDKGVSILNENDSEAALTGFGGLESPSRRSRSRSRTAGGSGPGDLVASFATPVLALFILVVLAIAPWIERLAKNRHIHGHILELFLIPGLVR